MKKEIYKTIKINGEKTNYKISNYGKVISKNYRHTKKEHELSLKTDKDGYKTVVLYINNKPKTFKVHRLVAEAFIKKPKNKNVVNHKNSKVYDNYIDNLEWCDTKYNVRYGFSEFGNHKIIGGESHHLSKFSNKNISYACKMLEENKLTLHEISNESSIPVHTLRQILKHNQWTIISNNYNIDNYDIANNRENIANEKLVKNICEELVNNKLTMTEISKKYNVTYGFVLKIKNHDRWNNISCMYDFSKYNKFKGGK